MTTKFLNKQGLSAVVTTLIIILLVMVSIGIIWVVVSNFVSGGAETLEIGAKCLEIDVTATALFNTSAMDYNVTFTRTASGDEIGGLKVVFSNAASETSGIIDLPGNIAPLSTVTRSVNGSISDANKVEFTPYFVDENGDEKLCSKTNSFSI